MFRQKVDEAILLFDLSETEVIMSADGNGVLWMDVSMVLTPGQMMPVSLHQVGNFVRVTVSVPDFPEVQSGYERTYRVFAYHAQAPEGQRLEVIDPQYNEDDDTLTFDISAVPPLPLRTVMRKTPAADTRFADVAEGTWFFPAVSWAVGRGITAGTGETTFSPDVECTRAQIVTFLWRYLDR